MVKNMKIYAETGFDKKEWATGRVRALKPRRAAEHPKESGRIRKNPEEWSQGLTAAGS